jgi:hypothetical protein
VRVKRAFPLVLDARGRAMHKFHRAAGVRRIPFQPEGPLEVQASSMSNELFLAGFQSISRDPKSLSTRLSTCSTDGTNASVYKVGDHSASRLQ